MKPNRPQNPNIDFSKVIDTDDIRYIEEHAKGVIAILNAMELAAEGSIHKYQQQAYYVLQMSLEQLAKDIEELKPNIEYMGDFMRYETIKPFGSSSEVAK